MSAVLANNPMLWITLVAKNGDRLLDYRIDRDVTELTKKACVYDVLHYPATVGIKCANDFVVPLIEAMDRLDYMLECAEYSLEPTERLMSNDEKLDYIELYGGLVIISQACAAFPDAAVC